MPKQIKKVPLTNSEKQKRYREKRKQNPERDAAYIAKENVRNSKRKTIDAMTNREVRAVRKGWRKRQIKSRNAKQMTKELEVPICLPIASLQQDNMSVQKKRGRQAVLKRRSQNNRDVAKLRKEVDLLKCMLKQRTREAAKYRKRHERGKNSDEKKLMATPYSELSPSSRAKKLLCISNIRVGMGHNVARKLVLCNSLTDVMAAQRTQSNNKLISHIIASKTITKYKLLRRASVAVGLKDRKRIAEQKKLKDKRMKVLIQAYFIRDDVSRHTAGKKETITQKKVKRQRRYLVDTLKNTYSSFIKAVPMDHVISYTTFCRYRPFYVLKPTQEDRDTCRCKLHTNLEFKAAKLRLLNVIDSSDVHQLTNSITCSKSSAKCMHNLCNDCSEKTVPSRLEIAEDQTRWNEWRLISEERTRSKEGKKFTFTVKVISKAKVTGTVGELERAFQQEMQLFKPHIFNIKNQNAAFNACKDNLNSWECALNVDFSENYNCKLSSEIQSYHFGAARHQATLHTGVFYVGGSSSEPVPFCTISDSSEHGPHAIWAHLQPILDVIKAIGPHIKVVHFFSDGPSSQYRQKKNFYLLSTRLFQLGFTATSWSFFEAGHGKNSADGVGAAVKQQADRFVAHGTDIKDAQAMFDTLSKVQSRVKLFFVNQAEIDSIAESIPKDLVMVKGTHKIHQLASIGKGVLKYRTVSCYCEKNDWRAGNFCECHLPAQVVHMERNTKKFTKTNIVQPKRGQGIYSSTSEEDEPPMPKVVAFNPQPQPSSSAEMGQDVVSMTLAASNIKHGTCVLVELKASGPRAKTSLNFRYAAVCQGEVEDDGDIKVMYLKHQEKGVLFSMDERDQAYISFDQVLSILPHPTLTDQGRRGLMYKFHGQVDVFEKL